MKWKINVFFATWRHFPIKNTNKLLLDRHRSIMTTKYFEKTKKNDIHNNILLYFPKMKCENWMTVVLLSWPPKNQQKRQVFSIKEIISDPDSCFAHRASYNCQKLSTHSPKVNPRVDDENSADPDKLYTCIKVLYAVHLCSVSINSEKTPH